MKRILIFFCFFSILCSVSFTGFAQKVKTVSATYIYYAPETMSVEEAKRTALENAKIEAIANEFGTIISQSSTSVISIEGNSTQNHFISLAASDVKGEWIEDIGDPKFGDIYYQDNLLIVPVSIKGKAREILSSKIEIIAKPLRNGIEEKFEAYEFKEGDSLYMKFQAAASGYLAIYLVDEMSQKVYCALPYKNSDGSPKRIEADKEYILFSQKKSDPLERRYIDEYEMICNQDREYNDFYILFSEEPFSKMIMPDQYDSKLPKTSDLKNFQKWLTKVRVKNPRLSLTKIPIIISKNL